MNNKQQLADLRSRLGQAIVEITVMLEREETREAMKAEVEAVGGAPPTAREKAAFEELMRKLPTRSKPKGVP